MNPVKEPMMKCPSCDGHGIMHGYDADCQPCNGTGKVTLVACLRHRSEIELRGAACEFDQPIGDFLREAADAIDAFVARAA